MPRLPRPETQSALPFKARALGRAASILIGCLCRTLRFRLEDRAGVVAAPPEEPLIWAFWHNRILAVPDIYRRYLPLRTGAVLTSPSRDGAIIAATMRCFGVAAVRGSSNKRGAAAMAELAEWLSLGHDVAITPDGPRGPRYRLAPGVLRLAQRTGCRVLPIRVEYDSAWVFSRSWDHFRLPKPFSRVRVIFDAYESIDPAAEGERFEAERARFERILNPDHETD